MGKLIKKGLIVSAVFFINLIFGTTVFAENQLTDLTIEVELQEDGSGIVTEHRKMKMDEGTELFIVLDELQDSELLDFSVAGFTEIKDWDSDDSLKEKAGHYGILETDNGLELVWGIGKYGANEYEVTYTLSNLVRELEDGQALLWNFDTFSDIPAENLAVEISGPESFTHENTKLWGFGFDGDIELVNGQVVWKAAEEVGSDNDVTVLLQFPPNFFDTQASVEQTLEEQSEMAKEGSAYNSHTSSDTIPIIIFSSIALIGGGIASIAITYAVKVKKAKEAAGQMVTGQKRIQENKGKLFEDVPFNGEDLAGIAYLLQEINTGYFEDYFSIYLLKWISEGKIHMETEKRKAFFEDTFYTDLEILDYEEERQFDGRSFAEFIEALQDKDGKESYEVGLWLMLLNAADKNGLVNDERIKKWAKRHADEVEEYADYLTDYSKDYLEEQGLLRFEEVEVWGKKNETVIASAEGNRLFDHLVQFRNYLEKTDLLGFEKNFSRLSLEDFLLWSTLYARSEEITQQFKELTPDPNVYYTNQQPLYYYWYWNGASGIRHNWSTGLSSGGFHSAASSASVGAGGATSVGGGGGAGGGGGGGAR